MAQRKIQKKCISIAVCLVMLCLLTGCGGAGEKTANATQMIQNLDYEGALAELAAAEEAGENLRLIERSRGIAYMGLTDYGRAAEAFLRSLAHSNGFVQNIDFDTNYYLAAAYTKDGRYSEAEDAYNAILALRPEEEDAYFLRGNVRMHLGDFQGAKEDFDRVLAMDAKNYDRLIEIYEVLAYFGYREEGQEYLQTALAAGDKKMDNFSRGRIYYYQGEYQKACLALEEARGEGSAESYLYLGRAYEATGDYNYAASVYSSYLGQYEANAEVYNQLGLCEMAKGEYTEALEAFQAGMQLENSTMMQALSFNEIVAYEYLGEYERAYVLINNYLKNYPDDLQARREYDFLSTR
ncbi:MAG: tetratricopeptide repeat protein [Butyrivibrio sp.]|nr:tetratricopeptide repeat protein [Acetatifactor muris]MCM1561030.1 tetratricopeptide repeat protein [Butyrivibrio sp.]